MNFGFRRKFYGTCFDHAFFKAYQYVVINEIFCKGPIIFNNKIPLNLICKMYNLVQKIQEKANKSGTRFVLIQTFFKEN